LEDFAALLAEARKNAGLTQTDLAAAAGLTPSYVSFLENRKKPPPSDDVCRRLASALDLPEERLLDLAHLERSPPSIREKVDRLTSSLHRERRSLRTFMEGLLSPFLFAGPPGYRDSAIDALGVSPARRRRIREAVKRNEPSKVARLLDELSDDELSELADRLPALLPSQPTLYEKPPENPPPTPFLLVAQEDVPDTVRKGDRLLVDPKKTPDVGDLVVMRDGALERAERAEDAEGALGVVTEIRRVMAP
jgi:transcriptional regulator with XRE-family HTH domain